MATIDPYDGDPIEAVRRERRRTRARRRSPVMIAGLAVLWVVLASDSALLWGVLTFLGYLFAGAVLCAAAMLGMAGFGLSAMVDRMVAACRRAGRWPDEDMGGDPDTAR